LKELEDLGIITKKMDVSRFPLKCEYSLTDSRKDFIFIIKEIKHWALTWKVDNELCEHLDSKGSDL
jgi:DNA-binding HxlR family transcriptional regulator